MTDTVLLVIDAQQSFYERGYRETPETPAFEKALSTLVAGCQ
ncbi:MAG TPA: hydrolase, partial [Erwinia persicina]|nr:hydrolase [Erwinia persicina]HBT53654.1 hydrolase [Erwinia persicina]